MSKKEYKSIAFVRRLKDPELCGKHTVKPRNITLLSRKQVQDNNTNRLVTKSLYLPVDDLTKFDKYKVSDFSTENLEAIGYVPTPVTMTGDVFTSMQNMARQFEQMEKSNNTKS